MPFRQHHLHPVGERGMLHLGQPQFRKRAQIGQLGAIRRGFGSLVFRVRIDFENINPIGQPTSSGGPYVVRGCGFNPFEAGLVSIRAAQVDLVAGQQIRFSSEPSYPLDPPQEAGQALILHALHLRGRRTALEQTRQFLVDRLLYFGHIVARPGSRLNPELAGDLLGGVERAHVGRDLVVVDQALIKPGTLALREHLAEQAQVIGVR